LGKEEGGEIPLLPRGGAMFWGAAGTRPRAAEGSNFLLVDGRRKMGGGFPRRRGETAGGGGAPPFRTEKNLSGPAGGGGNVGSTLKKS